MSKPIWTTKSKRLNMIVGTGTEGTTEGQEKRWEGWALPSWILEEGVRGFPVTY